LCACASLQGIPKTAKVNNYIYQPFLYGNYGAVRQRRWWRGVPAARQKARFQPGADPVLLRISRDNAAAQGVEVSPAKDGHMAGDAIDAGPLMLVVVNPLPGGTGIDRGRCDAIVRIIHRSVDFCY
jgi:hypothetical protein